MKETAVVRLNLCAALTAAEVNPIVPAVADNNRANHQPDKPAKRVGVSRLNGPANHEPQLHAEMVNKSLIRTLGAGKLGRRAWD
jgi:hypothetical protein